MSSSEVTVALRIPGTWTGPRDLLAQLPKDCRLTPECLTLPDGTAIDFSVVDADDQFAEVFRTACRSPATPAEQRKIEGYTANVLLSGPGGSLEAARTMMQAAAVIIEAGGAGVFIDNSALSHGGEVWREMADDGGSDALSFAFVALIRGQADVRTMGMHVLGLRELVMKRTDVEVDGFDITEVIRYVCRGEKPIESGHLIADPAGPRFQAFLEESPASRWPDSPMHNPFGQIRLVSIRDMAESN